MNQNPPVARIRKEIFGDEITVLTFDAPESPVNLFDADTLAELESLVDALADDPGLRGVIFASAKPGIFLAGADLKALSGAGAEELEAMTAAGQRVFGKVAALACPTAAAIHGVCLGGGLELALACDWRVASSDRATKLGLPETQLGILPAWGGCTRLPRLVGLPVALDLILSGKTLSPGHARKLGLVDDVSPRERVVERAAQRVASGKPPRRSRYRLLNNPLAAAVIRDTVAARLARKTRGNYPAPAAALEAITRGVCQSEEDSLKGEREAVALLASGEVARQLLRVFFLQEAAKKTRWTPACEARPVRRAAVIGAGVMGAGIAQWTSARGVPVILQDLDPARVGAGMKTAAKIYAGAVKRRIFTPVEAMRQADLIVPAADPVPLDRVDLVIEAAVERMKVKREIFADLSRRVSPEAVLATNTSALSVTELARSPGVTGPERILGIHFFNPVHQMKLVEVVVTPQTSGVAVETALAFVRRLGKLPVVVKDSPGFLVNRVLMPYLIEAGRLFDRGMAPEDIDGAMLDFGMPMGPLRLLDEVGLDVALHVGETMSAVFGERFALPAVLGRLVEQGQAGRKAGRGIYAHGGKQAVPNPAALQARSSGGSLKGEAADRAGVAERMALLMVNESYRVLEEGVAGSADDIDLAMILGTGFAPFRGGPMSWARSVGPALVREKLLRLAESSGPAFAPADSLR